MVSTFFNAFSVFLNASFGINLSSVNNSINNLEGPGGFGGSVGKLGECGLAGSWSCMHDDLIQGV